MERDKDRIERYIAEVSKVASEVADGCRIDVQGAMMRVMFGTANGKVTVLSYFYTNTVRVAITHSAAVSELDHMKLAHRLAELNEFGDQTMIYNYLQKHDCLAFAADYALRRRDPQDDAGLDGFCTLIFKTAPQRLDEMAAMVKKADYAYA